MSKATDCPWWSWDETRVTAFNLHAFCLLEAQGLVHSWESELLSISLQLLLGRGLRARQELKEDGGTQVSSLVTASQGFLSFLGPSPALGGAPQLLSPSHSRPPGLIHCSRFLSPSSYKTPWAGSLVLGDWPSAPWWKWTLPPQKCFLPSSAHMGPENSHGPFPGGGSQPPPCIPVPPPGGSQAPTSLFLVRTHLAFGS